MISLNLNSVDLENNSRHSVLQPKGNSTTSSRDDETDIASKLPWKRMEVVSGIDAPKAEKIQRKPNSVEQYLSSHWTSLLVSSLVFLVLCGAGLLLSTTHFVSLEIEAQNQADSLASEAITWLDEALHDVVMPLYSLIQFATELPVFRDLPNKIGSVGDNGSLPLLPPVVTAPMRRDISNSPCSDPQNMEQFARIASSIKQFSGAPEGVILSLALIPDAVLCFTYPLINRDDFPPGIYLNNTPSLGMDFLADDKLRFHGDKTLKSHDVVTAGPISLRHCVDNDDCDPLVEKALVARLPVPMPGHSIHFEGNTYTDKWGFVSITINWKALVEKSGIMEKFEKYGHEFSLTRKDRLYGNESEVVVLAESPGFYNDNRTGLVLATTTLTNEDREWEMNVKFAFSPVSQAWHTVIVPVIIIVSFCISCLVCTVLLQKQVHTEMKGQTRAQEAKVETERNMTAYFAHELRNPLGAIDSALTAMPDELPPEARELLEGMRHCSQFMSSIMNNLLDVRQMEEGKLTLHRSPLELDKLLAKLHQMLLPSVKDRVEFKYVANTSNRNWVIGDVYRLHQVMANVVGNAIKYTLSGSVTLKVGWEGKQIKFECIDTGPGIPKEEQAALFERYVKRGGAPGNGLGLAIAKHIVDMMQGSIRFESDPTVAPGTSCIVLLPLEECNEPSSAFMVNSSDEGPIEAALRIMIVDDIKMNRMMLKRRFQKNVAPNCIITEASTGEESLEICKSESFDVIIVDQYMEEAMGVLLGTDTIIAMRRMGVHSLIIGCSGNDMDQEFVDAGADFVWKKPMPSNPEIIHQLREGVRDKLTTV